MTLSLGAHPPASHTLVHLSDPHFLADGLLSGRYDSAEGFRRTLAAIEAAHPHPDALVVTGDLAELGEPEAYRRLRSAVEPVAERLGAPVVWVAGNHDERPALHASLRDAPPTEDPVTGVWDLRGLRLVALDTSVPGWHHGDLDPVQLDWLREQLRAPAPHGTVLAMHHPPLPSHIPFFDILELRSQDALAAAIAGTDVRGILAGHLHHSASGMFAGVPVSVASSTCYTMALDRPADRVNGWDAAQAFQLVHVYPGTIVHSVVPVASAPVAEHFTPEWTRRMAALDPQERLELFSRKPGWGRSPETGGDGL